MFLETFSFKTNKNIISGLLGNKDQSIFTDWYTVEGEFTLTSNQGEPDFGALQSSFAVAGPEWCRKPIESPLRACEHHEFSMCETGYERCAPDCRDIFQVSYS